MSFVIRSAKADDMMELQKIWKTVFEDTDEIIDKFFDIYYAPQNVYVAESDSIIAASGYIIPVGNLFYRNQILSCAMIYSMGTLPEYRGEGLGTAVVRSLISTGFASGYNAIVLCPSTDQLFEYYSDRTELCEWFYVNEERYERLPTIATNLRLESINDEEYSILREKILSGIPHIGFDLPALSFQSCLCKQFGGGFFRIAHPKASTSCILVERQQNGDVWIKELLTAEEDKALVLSAIGTMFPADGYLVRTPVLSTQSASHMRRFGMLAIDKNQQNTEFDSAFGYPAPLYGLAFD